MKYNLASFYLIQHAVQICEVSLKYGSSPPLVCDATATFVYLAPSLCRRGRVISTPNARGLLHLGRRVHNYYAIHVLGPLGQNYRDEPTRVCPQRRMGQPVPIHPCSYRTINICVFDILQRDLVRLNFGRSACCTGLSRGDLMLL